MVWFLCDLGPICACALLAESSDSSGSSIVSFTVCVGRKWAKAQSSSNRLCTRAHLSPIRSQVDGALSLSERKPTVVLRRSLHQRPSVEQAAPMRSLAFTSKSSCQLWAELRAERSSCSKTRTQRSRSLASGLHICFGAQADDRASERVGRARTL